MTDGYFLHYTSRKTVGIIAGAVVGGIILVLIVMGIVCWVKVKKGQGQVRNNASPTKPVVHQVHQPVIHQGKYCNKSVVQPVN